MDDTLKRAAARRLRILRDRRGKLLRRLGCSRQPQQRARLARLLKANAAEAHALGDRRGPLARLAGWLGRVAGAC